jgi:ABC-type molybdate transport system substrate-binding protein
VLNSARDRALADEFVKFLQSDDGQAIFRKFHYRTEPPAEGP